MKVSAALKDFAISINIPCPSVVVWQSSSDATVCQLYLQLCCPSTLPCGERRQWNLQPPLSCIVLFWSAEHVCFVLIDMCRLHSGLSFSVARKNKFECKLSHPWVSFPLSWGMATRTKDTGLGCGCSIKLQVLCGMQNRLVEEESSCGWWTGFEPVK